MDKLIPNPRFGFLVPMENRSRLVEQLPRQVYIEVTNLCNSVCISCPLTYDHFLPIEPKHHLGWDEFRRIVDQLPILERVVLHGIGEPMLNMELPRFVAHLKERGAEVLFNTNGILLDQKRGDALVAAGLDELRVSIDAVTPELYAQLRGVDALKKIVDNLKAFVTRHGGRKRPMLSLWLVGMQANLHQLPDFVRLGAEIGVSEVYLQRLVYLGSNQRIGEGTTMEPGQSLYSVLEQKQEKLIFECEHLANELEIVFHASGATTPLESMTLQNQHPWQGCLRPWNLMYITANGTALPCCISPFAAADYSSILLGNVLERPVEEVWNGPRYQELRSAVKSDDPAPWPCQDCGIKWSL
jgi:MoaA/NifB/PqqE/SkfB family radical SAM enzyme